MQPVQSLISVPGIPPIKTRAEHLSFGSCFISLIELKTDIGNPTAPLWPAPTLQQFFPSKIQLPFLRSLSFPMCQKIVKKVMKSEQCFFSQKMVYWMCTREAVSSF